VLLLLQLVDLLDLIEDLLFLGFELILDLEIEEDDDNDDDDDDEDDDEDDELRFFLCLLLEFLFVSKYSSLLNEFKLKISSKFEFFSLITLSAELSIVIYWTTNNCKKCF